MVPNSAVLRVTAKAFITPVVFWKHYRQCVISVRSGDGLRGRAARIKTKKKEV